MKPLFILIGLLPLVGCKHESATNTDAEAAASRRSESVSELIEQLAISDQPGGEATIVTPHRNAPNDDPRVRAYSAANKLLAIGRPAFPELLKHLDDKRQSVAFRRVIEHNVGDACYCILREQIFALPDDYSGSFYREGADGKMHPRPYFLEEGLFDSTTIAEWLDERNGLSLRDLQIEALNWLFDEENKIG